MLEILSTYTNKHKNDTFAENRGLGSRGATVCGAVGMAWKSVMQQLPLLLDYKSY